jgi:hypothetical protein
MRTVPDDKAFYFYRAWGAPLGTRAKSLREFAEQLKSIDPISVKFHLERHDFQNWLLMLGDVTLARQMSALIGKGLSQDQLQQRLTAMVQMRVEKLGSLVR